MLPNLSTRDSTPIEMQHNSYDRTRDVDVILSAENITELRILLKQGFDVKPSSQLHSQSGYLMRSYNRCADSDCHSAMGGLTTHGPNVRDHPRALNYTVSPTACRTAKARAYFSSSNQ